MGDWRSFLYGGLSSMIAEFVTFPMDTTKTRLQIQGQTQTTDESVKKIKYKGMLNTLLKIKREEGLSALYSGVRPALLRQATYGTLKFGIYQTLKQAMRDQGMLVNPNTGEERVLTNILCAALAGSTSSALTNPTDVLKVRLQQHPDQDPRLLRGMISIYKKEGIHGLWRGVFGTAQRAAITTSVGLPAYDYFKYHLIIHLGDHVANHFISAGLASCLGAVISTPFDVLRTRVMDDTADVYKGIFDCLLKTIRSEGILALYKGLIPILLRMGPWNITFFVTYEQLKKIY